VQNHDLHVNAAHVANAVCVREVVQTSAGMRNRFHHRAIRSQNPLQQIFAVPRNRQPHNFAFANRLPYLTEQHLRIFNRISPAKRVARVQQLLRRRQTHCLRRGGPKIASHHHAPQLPNLRSRRYRPRRIMPVPISISVSISVTLPVPISPAVPRLECLQLHRILPQSSPPHFFLLFVLALFNPPPQFLNPQIHSRSSRLPAPHLHASLRRIVQ